MNIRPYRSTDWDDVLALEIETGLATLHGSTAEEREAFVRRWPDQLRSLYEWTDSGPSPEKHTVLVLEVDTSATEREFAGHLWLTVFTDFFSAEPKLYITTVAIVARHRAKGLGTALLDRAFAEARERGIANVGLGVDARNVGAIRLYEKLGFVTVRQSMERIVE